MCGNALKRLSICLYLPLRPVTTYTSSVTSTGKLLDARQAREAFHLILLDELGGRLSHEHWVLKGGVNLRAFFQSIRFSEDIDIDAVLLKRQAIRKHLREILKSETFLRRIRSVGIQNLLVGDKEISKDSETTLRFNRGVIVGGVPHSTTVEVSFRVPDARDRSETAAVDSSFCETYLGLGTSVQAPHYVRLSALAQKLDALANRAAVQARDVFDICWLTRVALDRDDRQWVAMRLGADLLQKARERAMEIEYQEYRDTVLDYLDPAESASYAGEDAWIEQQLRVVTFADELLALIGSGEIAPDVDTQG